MAKQWMALASGILGVTVLLAGGRSFGMERRGGAGMAGGDLCGGGMAFVLSGTVATGAAGGTDAPEPWENHLKFLNISPYVDPEDAFTKILPKIMDKQRLAGHTWAEYGEITTKQKVPPMVPGSEAEVIGSTIRWHTGDKAGETLPMMMRVETSKPMATGSWVIHVDQYSAPKAEAARDFQLMGQIYSSINIPQAAINRQLDKDNKAFQAVSAYFQAQHEALMENGRQFQANQKEQFERFENQQAAQARHDACSDMIESSLGVRDVLDTNTGQMHQVDLYNSTAITDTLNGLANDPNRFVQIPLRYER